MKTSNGYVAVLILSVLSAGLLGTGVGYRLHSNNKSTSAGASLSPVDRTPIYYRDPDGKADYSPTPKKTAEGRDFVPVYDEAASGAPPDPVKQKRILYYRNPMGLSDTSPVPKKDAMGMDYVPVYADNTDAGVVTVSSQRIQMLGVRIAPVGLRAALSRAVHASGAIAVDEERLAIVTAKFDGFVEKLSSTLTGSPVRAGQPLARVWIQTPDVITRMGPDIVTRQIDYIVALQEKNGPAIAQAVVNLRNYGIPDSTLSEIRRTGRATRWITITAPRGGVVLEKTAIEGMRFNAGDPLFKIGDLSTVWLLADVAEQDLGNVRLGQTAHATLVAYPGRVYDGVVDLIYPGLAAATRTGRIRISLPNPDGSLRESMYASVTIDPARESAANQMSVPDSAIIDSGARQVVLVALGQGRFEPRSVRVGTRGDGFTQIVSGLSVGEHVVVGANFLIDAESNLRAALQAFSPAETKGAP